MEEIPTTTFNDDVPIKHQAFLQHLQKLESQAGTIKQILHLAESIGADGIVMSCKGHITNTLSTIPAE